MRLVLATVFAAALCAQFQVFAAAPNTGSAKVLDIDRVLVVVNDDAITAREFQSRLNAVKREITLRKGRIPPDDVLRKQVLDRMIIERLQLQYAERSGVRVADEAVERTLQGMAERNKMSVTQLRQALERDGVSYAAFRESVRSQLVVRQLLERDINARINVAESEVDNFLANQAAQGGISQEFNVSHIVIPIAESATPAVIQEAKKRADELRAKLRAGQDFEQAAVEYSQGQEALEGGKLGWKKSGQLPDLFRAALVKMQPGEISEVLRSPNGFHVLKLNDMRGGVRKPVNQTHARHILIKTGEFQPQPAALQKIKQIRARIEGGEDFAALARAVSEDTGTNTRGGDLGWVSPGSTVPAFEKAMDALKPGQVSEPVVTQFGAHLIQVIERRRQDVGNERDRAEARQQIHARKADELFEQWVRQLRDEAYVEYRLDSD